MVLILIEYRKTFCHSILKICIFSLFFGGMIKGFKIKILLTKIVNDYPLTHYLRFLKLKRKLLIIKYNK